MAPVVPYIGLSSKSLYVARSGGERIDGMVPYGGRSLSRDRCAELKVGRSSLPLPTLPGDIGRRLTGLAERPRVARADVEGHD
tara:strand:- start:186 stop:434 length:249 start_codon:yes stop_codon:yes gene_type:complete